jgi:hypothetical protein
MPILLWVVYPIALWSACAGMIVPLSEAARDEDLLKH